MTSEETEMVLTDRITEIKEELDRRGENFEETAGAAEDDDVKEEESDPFVDKDDKEDGEVKDEIGQLL